MKVHFLQEDEVNFVVLKTKKGIYVRILIFISDKIYEYNGSFGVEPSTLKRLSEDEIRTRLKSAFSGLQFNFDPAQTKSRITGRVIEALYP